MIVAMAIFATIYLCGHFSMTFFERKTQLFPPQSVGRWIYHGLSMIVRMVAGGLPMVLYNIKAVDHNNIIAILSLFGMIYFGFYPSLRTYKKQPQNIKDN